MKNLIKVIIIVFMLGTITSCVAPKNTVSVTKSFAKVSKENKRKADKARRIYEQRFVKKSR